MPASLVLVAALAACVGLMSILLGATGWRRPAAVRRPARRGGLGEGLVKRLPGMFGGDVASLRLTGTTPQQFATQRFLGLCVGAAGGLVMGTVVGWGASGRIGAGLLGASVAWIVPLLSLRDAASRARSEMDQTVRLWIALVAQQVSAGTPPSQAMLTAARMGQRQSWQVLYRLLLTAQQEGRPVWTGLEELVDRYGVQSLAPVVSSLGLAAQRGTRLSEAVLVAADTLWRDALAREREKAAKRSQVIVFPATGIAFGLAAILVYPPFASLTGGGLGGL